MRRSSPDPEPVRDITWEQPPNKIKFDWPHIAEKLRKHPFQWAKIFDHERTSVVNAIRQGSVIAVHPDRGFEVRTANNVREPVRMCTLYMRFNPDRVKGLAEATQGRRPRG